MSPGEIRACYRLYAAHRRSNEICAFSEAILAMNDVGASAELAVLARLNTGLEGDTRSALATPMMTYARPFSGISVTCERFLYC
jgi:hypothetical protein